MGIHDIVLVFSPLKSQFLYAGLLLFSILIVITKVLNLQDDAKRKRVLCTQKDGCDAMLFLESLKKSLVLQKT